MRRLDMLSLVASAAAFEKAFQTVVVR